MPGTYCAVAGCKNSRTKVKNLGMEIIFHSFPKDRKVWQAWAQICCRVNKVNPRTSYVCSAHFSDADYERDLQGELLGLPKKRRLRSGGIINST